MANIKTAISLHKALSEKIDRLAREMKVSRNRLLVLALEDYIQRHQNLQLLEKINQAYADLPDPAEEKCLRQARQQQRKIVEGEW